MNKKIKFRIVVIIGSVTTHSNTRKAAHIAIDELNKHEEIVVDLIDPRELDLPFPGIKSSSLKTKELFSKNSLASGIRLKRKKNSS